MSPDPATGRLPIRLAQSVQILSILLLIFLVGLFGYPFLAARGAADLPAPAATPGAMIYQIHLPYVSMVTEFSPSVNGNIAGGTYTFSTFTVPSGVSITFSGDVVIEVMGDIDIAGNLLADCTKIEINGKAGLSVTGMIDNHCSADDTNAGDLILTTRGASFQMGSASTPAQVNTSGNLDLANDPGAEDWQYDVLPDQRSAAKLPPVCSASSDTVENTVMAGEPAEVRFYAEGADPDGGPLSFAWDFGDSSGSSERDPVHTYTVWGSYPVTLTVTDDEAQDCQATLVVSLDDGDTNFPTEPGVWAEPFDLVAATGQAVAFDRYSLDPLGETLTYAWDFGDASSSTEAAPTHSYAAAGRYPVSLTVMNASGLTSTAVGAIYIYPDIVSQAAQPALAGSPSAAQASCAAPDFNVIYNGMSASGGRDGRSARFRGRGNMFLGSGTNIQAQDGGDGVSRSGAGHISGGRGGRGGSLQILVNGSITICGGASLSAGDGGDGGSATSNTPAPGMAWASGGQGGRAARLLRISATGGVAFELSPFSDPVTLNPGSGGSGGSADATGGDGLAQCPVGQDGASAKATGGDGGRATKLATVSGNVAGLANVEVDGGQGGQGGGSTAFGGDGGAALSCVGTATGGMGKFATARGGRGGDAKLSGAGGFGLTATAFTAGNGGSATAWGGWGGDALATPAGACGDTTNATGGQAAKGSAYGGKGGAGRQDGDGGDAAAHGGWGGDATATGSDCPVCGGAGGSAVATAGDGADGEAKYGQKGGATAADGTATAEGLDGGAAHATGGHGGDCPICPGDGGPGGAASATGGDGGSGLGNGTNTGGDGGTGDAQGGKGGYGANCCDKFNEQPGGVGGDGGDATSVAGVAGMPGGSPGANQTGGGDGGDGGDGQPPGAGGAGGTGAGTPLGIPNGSSGQSGAACPAWIVWYIYHSNIPEGPILPGSDLPLPVYTDTVVTADPIGQVMAHFMDATEFGNPVNYQKVNPDVFVSPGGIRYDLSGLPPSFPALGIQVTIQHNCSSLGCVQLIGLRGGQPVASVTSQQISPADPETLLLSDPGGLPFDGFILTGEPAFSFDHWWIVIIDP